MAVSERIIQDYLAKGLTMADVPRELKYRLNDRGGNEDLPLLGGAGRHSGEPAGAGKETRTEKAGAAAAARGTTERRQ